MLLAADAGITAGTLEGILASLFLLAVAGIAGLARMQASNRLDRERILQEAKQNAHEDTFAELKAINASLIEQRDFFKAQWEEARKELNELRERIAMLERGGMERREQPQRPRHGGRRGVDP